MVVPQAPRQFVHERDCQYTYGVSTKCQAKYSKTARNCRHWDGRTFPTEILRISYGDPTELQPFNTFCQNMSQCAATRGARIAYSDESRGSPLNRDGTARWLLSLGTVGSPAAGSSTCTIAGIRRPTQCSQAQRCVRAGSRPPAPAPRLHLGGNGSGCLRISYGYPTEGEGI